MSYYTKMIRKFAKDWMDFFLQESLRYTGIYCIGYQEKCRFYVDEFPEQEKLRQEYSAKKLIESIVKENPRTYCEEVETDNFFYERFMRRK